MLQRNGNNRSQHTKRNTKKSEQQQIASEIDYTGYIYTKLYENEEGIKPYAQQTAHTRSVILLLLF